MRRYAPMTQSKGTVIPRDMRLRVLSRDAKAAGGCVGFRGFSHSCYGALELDHVRASHGTGMKSVTCDCNLVSLCGGCHRYKTEHGREVRPILLDYLARFRYTEHADGHLDRPEHVHVDPVFGCLDCYPPVSA